MRHTAWPLLVGLGLVAGCGPSAPPPVAEPPTATEPEETLVVYSLEPWRLDEWEKLEAGEVEFHRYLVIGSTTVAEPKPRTEILDAVRKGNEDADQDPTKHKMCKFSPRHGLHHVAKDGTETDWVICFSCGQVRLMENGKPLKKWETEDFIDGRRYAVNLGNITRGPQKLLDRTLTDAGIKLAPGADKGE